MKKLLLVSLSGLFLVACSHAVTDEQVEVVTSKSQITKSDSLQLGEAVDMNALVDFETVMQSPDDFVGKTITLKGKVDKVCKKKGCWADITSGNEKLRVKVKDDEIVIPLYTLGSDAYATGVLAARKFDMEQTLEYLQHMADDADEEFDPSSVTEPLTFYQLNSKAVTIL